MQLNFNKLNGMTLDEVLERFEELDFELLGTETINPEIELETFDSRHGFRVLFSYHYSDRRCYNFRIQF